MDNEFGLQRMKIIDLKEEEYFIEQYVTLRNNHTELLLTLPVSISETREWLKRNDIEVRGFVQDDVLLGVVILYKQKDGEVAFFVRYPSKGIGGKLLKEIEEVAREKKLRFIRAWVRKDNLIAQRVFEKNGFKKGDISKRESHDGVKLGTEYKKLL